MPDTPSDPWDDLISQVEASLDHADYPQGPMREAVLEGIRSALAGMEEPRPTLRLVEPEPEGLEGKQREQRREARPERERPALRLAHRRAPLEQLDELFTRQFGDLRSAPDNGPDDEIYGRHADADRRYGLGGDPDDLDPDDPGPDDLGPDDLDMTDPGLLFRRPSRERPLIEEGRIFLVAATSRQWIWRGAAARGYRIGCTLGAFGVRVDGEEAFTVSEGQSVDVEGARIEIGDAAPAGTEGIYARLVG